jgi:hypothetical protein
VITELNGMRSALALLIAIATAACGAERLVKIGWDVPAKPSDGYRVLVDDHTVMDIPTPPVDPRCACLAVEVRVPHGEHTVKVVAYNRGGESSAAASIVVH